jgi:hypothetical protein
MARASSTLSAATTARASTPARLALSTNLKAIDEEYLEVRPYFVGDFYPLEGLLHLTPVPGRSGSSTGPISRQVSWRLSFRRQGSAVNSVQPGLKAIDPQAQYEVEIRTGLEKGPSNKMSGQDLTNLQVAIPGEPGSALLFYKRL